MRAPLEERSDFDISVVLGLLGKEQLANGSAGRHQSAVSELPADVAKRPVELLGRASRRKLSGNDVGDAKAVIIVRKVSEGRINARTIGSKAHAVRVILSFCEAPVHDQAGTIDDIRNVVAGQPEEKTSDDWPWIEVRTPCGIIRRRLRQGGVQELDCAEQEFDHLVYENRSAVKFLGRLFSTEILSMKAPEHRAAGSRQLLESRNSL